MPYSIWCHRRKRTKKGPQGQKISVTDRFYTAEIRFTGDHVGKYLRGTGKTSEREAYAEARRIAREIEEIEIPQKQKQAF